MKRAKAGDLSASLYEFIDTAAVRHGPLSELSEKARDGGPWEQSNDGGTSCERYQHM